MFWSIRCANDHSLFWSNEFGWCHKGYDVFTADEKSILSLPIEGEWVRFKRKRRSISTPSAASTSWFT